MQKMWGRGPGKVTVCQVQSYSSSQVAHFKFYSDGHLDNTEMRAAYIGELTHVTHIKFK